jgi:ABC-2 type transport system permease protein
MKYAFLVAWREYAESAKAKGFWISLLLMPLVLFLTIQVPILLEQKATPIRYFVVMDQSGQFASLIGTTLENNHQKQVLEALNDYAAKYSARPDSTQAQNAASALAQFGEGNPQALNAFRSKGGQEFYLAQLQPLLRPGAPPFKEPRRQFQAVPLPDGIDTNADLNSVAHDLRPYLRGDKRIERQGAPVELYAAVLIPKDIEARIVRPHHQVADASAQIQFWSKDATAAKVGFGLAQEIERAVNTEVRRREYLAKGLDSALVGDIEHTYAPFATLNPKKEAGQEAVTGTDIIRQWAPSGFVYVLWLAIFVIIQMLLNNTIEEKSNRIIEVLLSSVTPGELMMGKLFGIAAIGLTMIGAWIGALFGILSWKAGGASQIASQLLDVLRASNLIPLFSLYFLFGYLMYAAIILSIGSVCNTIKEAQSYMGILTVVLMVPLMTMTYIPKDPNGPVARLLSWIPIYTPFTMMNRANADPPLIDLVGTFILLVATTALALWMSGKIFRIGILRTGQPPRIVEMLRWALRRES